MILLQCRAVPPTPCMRVPSMTISIPMTVNVNFRSKQITCSMVPFIKPILWYKGLVFTYRNEIEKNFFTYVILLPRLPPSLRRFVSCKAAVISTGAYSDINSLQNPSLRFRPGHTMRRQDALSPTILAEGSVRFHVPWFHRNILFL